MFLLSILSSLLFITTTYAEREEFHEQLDLFTPFNLNLTNGGYVIQGTLSAVFLGNSLPKKNITMGLDPNNNRMFYDLGQTGIQIITQNDAYIYGNHIFGPICTRVNGFNYAKQVEAYRAVLSRPGSNTNKAEYAGDIDDVATCAHGLATVLEVKHDIIISMTFSQRFTAPIGTGGSMIPCTKVVGIMEFDMTTIDRNVARLNSYFTSLPADCTPTAAVDYCSLMYPVGNPCIIPQ
jgi:hypothetical protein